MISLRSTPILSAVGFLVTLVAFLFGLAIFFPVDSLRPRLQEEATKRGLQLSIGELRSVFPLGLAAKSVNLSGRGMGEVAFKLDEVRLSPSLLSLLGGKVVVSFEARLLGGEVKGTVERSGSLKLKGEGITWRGPLPGLSGGTLATRLRQAEVSAAWPIQPETPISLAIDCEETTIEGFLGAKAPLLIGNVTINASGQGKDLRVTTLTASGGQIGLDGSGTILLNDPLGRSLLNLNLTLRGQNGLDPTLAELLTAFLPPAADGTSRLRLGGTLASPQKVMNR